MRPGSPVSSPIGRGPGRRTIPADDEAVMRVWGASSPIGRKPSANRTRTACRLPESSSPIGRKAGGRVKRGKVRVGMGRAQ